MYVYVRYGSRSTQIAYLMDRRVKDGVKQVKLQKWRDNSRTWTAPAWYIATDVLTEKRPTNMDPRFARAKAGVQYA